MSMAAQMAMGVPKPAAPSMNAPKLNAISSSWMRRSTGQPGDGPPDLLELAGLDRDVVDEDRAEHDPANREEPEGGPVGGGRGGRLDRHPEDHDRDQQRGAQPGQGRDVRLDPQQPQQPQQHDDRQGGHQRGQDDIVGNRGVVLGVARGDRMHVGQPPCQPRRDPNQCLG
jgi:hypothetical protein